MSNRTDRLTGCHEHLAQIYERYPLARLLVESAGNVTRTSGHNFSSCHLAYSDWLLAVFGSASRDMREVLWVIDQLIPADHAESSVYQYNPTLPGLPPRPTQGESRRREAMCATLEGLVNQERDSHLISPSQKGK